MRFLTKKGLYDSGRVLFLPVEDIAPNPGQPRTQFSQPELEELAALLEEAAARKGRRLCCADAALHPCFYFLKEVLRLLAM